MLARRSAAVFATVPWRVPTAPRLNPQKSQTSGKRGRPVVRSRTAVLGLCDGLEVLDAIVVALAIQVINNHFLVGVVGFKFSDGGAIVRFENADVD